MQLKYNFLKQDNKSNVSVVFPLNIFPLAYSHVVICNYNVFVNYLFLSFIYKYISNFYFFLSIDSRLTMNNITKYQSGYVANRDSYQA